MKKRFTLATLALVMVLGITVGAVGGMTIQVDPVNIQVNGQTFQPKDVNGNDVPVFAYNGTTYAPLRALAEAYGLTVGYDAAQNMATVTDPKAGTSTRRSHDPCHALYPRYRRPELQRSQPERQGGQGGDDRR